MNNRFSKIIILLVIVLLIVLAIVFLWPRAEQEKPAEKFAAPTPDETIGQPASVLSEQEKQAMAIKVLATVFVERFGSFSNQGNYLNVAELFPLLTPTMSNWVKNTYLPKLQKDYPADGFYYKISTKAPVVDIIEEGDTQMKLQVATQRQEERAGESGKSFLQKIMLILKKENNQWLVDGAYWQK